MSYTFWNINLKVNISECVRYYIDNIIDNNLSLSINIIIAYIIIIIIYSLEFFTSA